MKIWDRLKDANRAAAPEESVPVRVAVLLTVLLAVVALLNESIVSGWAAAAALVLIPAGFWSSYRYRYQDLLALKGVLSIGLIVAMVAFLSTLSSVVQTGDIAQTQLALAELFLWVQILHSIHVPARRDLVISLVSSSVMLAITSSLSVSLAIAPFIVGWLLGLAVSLVLMHRSGHQEVAQAIVSDAGLRSTSRTVTAALLATVVAAGLVFSLLPASETSQTFAFPTSLGSTSRPLTNPGGLSNPSLGNANPEVAGGSLDGLGSRQSFGYFGFADQLDTGVRGRPDETLVMRVRASEPAFWRGQTFDTWDGRTWTQSDPDTQQISEPNPKRLPGTSGDTGFGGEAFVQTFYLETPGPNLVFGAYRVTDVHIADGSVFHMSDGTIRTGVEMGAGAVYTVVSSRFGVTESLLRNADPRRIGVPDEIADRYLQMPADMPQRVIDLAAAVTAGSASSYDAIRDLEQWMAENTTYTLDIPPLPEGVDATEHYLFITQQGFCEQIGSSLVMMLRSLGIPARLAIGYTPGDRNPFTGLYEVRASNAHSWAEVWFPGVGWQGFDPTAVVPLSGDVVADRAGSGLGTYLASRFGAIVENAGTFGRVVGVVLALAILAYLGAQVWVRRRRLATLDWPGRMLHELDTIGAARGRPRAPDESAVRYVEALSGEKELVAAAAAIERATYSATDIQPIERRATERTLTKRRPRR